MISSEDDHVNLARNSSIGLEVKPHQCLGWFFKAAGNSIRNSCERCHLILFWCFRNHECNFEKEHMFFICNLRKTEEVMKFPIQFRRSSLATFTEHCADSRWTAALKNTILKRDWVHLGKFPLDISCTSTGFLSTFGCLTQLPSTEQNHNKHWLERDMDILRMLLEEKRKQCFRLWVTIPSPTPPSFWRNINFLWLSLFISKDTNSFQASAFMRIKNQYTNSVMNCEQKLLTKC